MDNMEEMTNIKLDQNNSFNNFKISDLPNFINLEALTLSGFALKKEDIATINSLQKIKYVCLNFCKLPANNISFNSNITTIVFNCCTNLDLKQIDFSNVHTLRIMGTKLNKQLVDMNDLKCNGNLKELWVNIYGIKNIEKVMQVAPNITKINIDGSGVPNEEVLKSLDISVSHQKFFMNEEPLFMHKVNEVQ